MQSEIGTESYLVSSEQSERFKNMSNPTALVQELWNGCNTLRHLDLSYGDYLEQLTLLLFLRMADEQPFNKPSPIPTCKDWPQLSARVERRLSVMEELEWVVTANLQRAAAFAKAF